MTILYRNDLAVASGAGVESAQVVQMAQAPPRDLAIASELAAASMGLL